MNNIKSMKLYTHVERIAIATGVFTVTRRCRHWTIFTAPAIIIFGLVNWAGYD